MYVRESIILTDSHEYTLFSNTYRHLEILGFEVHRVHQQKKILSKKSLENKGNQCFWHLFRNKSSLSHAERINQFIKNLREILMLDNF